MRIEEVAESFLAYLARAPADPIDDEERLGLLLDQIAMAMHLLEFEFDETDYPAPPELEYAKLRARASKRFPHFGWYNQVIEVHANVGTAEVCVGDALDDVVDIELELREFVWRLANTSRADALWCLQNSYRSHWRLHVRGLQSYLESQE